jgi:hypothetical protein
MRRPTEIAGVYAAQLRKRDWSFSGRKGESRRTITASITKSGMDKLRSNIVYSKNTPLPKQSTMKITDY